MSERVHQQDGLADMFSASEEGEYNPKLAADDGKGVFYATRKKGELNC